jgi:hypothetical protein
MSNIQKIDPGAVQMFSSIAQSLAKSGFFPIGGQYQARTPEEQAAQAFVKIMAGHELGIGPVLAMQHIHIIDGKTSLDATMVAGLIKSSGKYDYDVEAMTATGCAITFYQIEGGQRRKLGTATWGEADAKRAGLAGRGNWGKYPRDMYFSRCVTFGARRFCPDVFLGPIYTPEELGADIPPAGAEPTQTAAMLTTRGDGAQHEAPPVAQLAENAGPDYEKLLSQIATRLQKAASKPADVWADQVEKVALFVSEWPADRLQQAQDIVDGISAARAEAMAEAMADDDTPPEFAEPTSRAEMLVATMSDEDVKQQFKRIVNREVRSMERDYKDLD